MVGRRGWHFQKESCPPSCFSTLSDSFSPIPTDGRTVVGSKLSLQSGKVKQLAGTDGKFALGPANENDKNYVNISLAVNIHKFWYAIIRLSLLDFFTAIWFLSSHVWLSTLKAANICLICQRQTPLLTRFMQEWKSQRICLVSPSLTIIIHKPVNAICYRVPFWAVYKYCVWLHLYGCDFEGDVWRIILNTVYSQLCFHKLTFAPPVLPLYLSRFLPIVNCNNNNPIRKTQRMNSKPPVATFKIFVKSWHNWVSLEVGKRENQFLSTKSSILLFLRTKPYPVMWTTIVCMQCPYGQIVINASKEWFPLLRRSNHQQLP